MTCVTSTTPPNFTSANDNFNRFNRVLPILDNLTSFSQSCKAPLKRYFEDGQALWGSGDHVLHPALLQALSILSENVSQIAKPTDALPRPGDIQVTQVERNDLAFILQYRVGYIPMEVVKSMLSVRLRRLETIELAIESVLGTRNAAFDLVPAISNTLIKIEQAIASGMALSRIRRATTERNAGRSQLQDPQPQLQSQHRDSLRLL